MHAEEEEKESSLSTGMHAEEKVVALNSQKPLPNLRPELRYQATTTTATNPSFSILYRFPFSSQPFPQRQSWKATEISPQPIILLLLYLNPTTNSRPASFPFPCSCSSCIRLCTLHCCIQEEHDRKIHRD
jgi:hypothetical protein